MQGEYEKEAKEVECLEMLLWVGAKSVPTRTDLQTTPLQQLRTAPYMEICGKSGLHLARYNVCTTEKCI